MYAVVWYILAPNYASEIETYVFLFVKTIENTLLFTCPIEGVYVISCRTLDLRLSNILK